MAAKSFLIISGTVVDGGLMDLYPYNKVEVLNELEDWMSEREDERRFFTFPITSEYYSVEFKSQYIFCSKYRAISDSQRDGYFSITIAIPNQHYFSWNVSKLLDDINERFIEINLVNNIIKKNVSGLEKIEEIFNNHVKDYETNLRDLPDATQDSHYGYVIYKNDEIRDYLQDPWREQYKEYRRIYFFDESLRSVLPTSDIFYKISDLPPRDNRYKLVIKIIGDDGKEVKDASIKINGKETDTIDEIRDSETIEIEVSRDFYEDFKLLETKVKNLSESDSLKINKSSLHNRIGELKLTITLQPRKYKFIITLIPADDKLLKKRHVSIDKHRPKRIEEGNQEYVFEDLHFLNRNVNIQIDEDLKYKGYNAEIEIDPMISEYRKKISLVLKPIPRKRKEENSLKKGAEILGDTKNKKRTLIYVLLTLVIVALSFLLFLILQHRDSSGSEPFDTDDTAEVVFGEIIPENGINNEADERESERTIIQSEKHEIDSLQTKLDTILTFANGIEFTPDSVEVYLGKLEEIGTTEFKDSLKYRINHDGEEKEKNYAFVKERLEDMKEIGEYMRNIMKNKSRLSNCNSLNKIYCFSELSESQNLEIKQFAKRSDFNLGKEYIND